MQPVIHEKVRLNITFGNANHHVAYIADISDPFILKL